ncbi:hypothetical protein [Bradyrhizobium sp. MOS002]|uniref:hypothetical protein n=1 Tax=Bradyrhizobium sp. MOS002 TaxID=2133947 RepID=UPI0011B21B89|nr:hypothetical protein [Bradyrhizobium sp. MOS002]
MTQLLMPATTPRPPSSEQVAAFDRNAWSRSIGISGRNPRNPHHETRLPGSPDASSFLGIFEVERFELGTGLWHARVLRSDHRPVVFDGEPFEFPHTEMSWPNAQAAHEDSKSFIDRMIEA